MTIKPQTRDNEPCLLVKPDFQVHEIPKETIRGVVHPAIKNPEQYLEGQPYSFTPGLLFIYFIFLFFYLKLNIGLDQVVGGDGINRLYRHNSQFVGVSSIL